MRALRRCETEPEARGGADGGGENGGGAHCARAPERGVKTENGPGNVNHEDGASEDPARRACR